MPYRTVRAASKEGLELALACGFLMIETGGGTNEFGHDPTIYIGAGVVTKKKYLAYKRERIYSGNTLMQGVGPMQLTWWSTQDEADAIGGCWNPYKNMIIGFRHAHENIERDGLHAGIAAYNGSGPAAQAYADRVLAYAEHFRQVLA